MFMSALCTH